MDVLQVLYSLWTSNREQVKELTEEQRERQAFDVGFKTAVQLLCQLENTEDIGGITK